MVASEHSHWPLPADAPADEDLSRCVHCGLCLTACPTYLVTGKEMDSPRGRIYLARSVAEGTLLTTPTVERHWDLCLQCRACETACPSGVPYGRIMEHVRAQVAEAPESDRVVRRVRRLVLRHIVARPRVLAAAALLPRKLAGLLTRERVAKLKPKPLRRLAGQIPRGQGAPVRPGFELRPAGQERARVALLTGCIMGEVFGEVHRATARVLARRGIAVEAVEGQGCCGALHAHDGDLAYARKLAKKNIAAMESDRFAAVVVNSAGCGAAMKEYDDLLAADPKWAARAAAFSAKVRDFSEYVAELGGEVPSQLETRVTYQDACHLAHAQRITTQPRALLDTITGCQRIETAGADRCCGAAGLYSVNQPAMSGELRQRKAVEIAASGAQIVTTANPGCHMQYLAADAESHLDVEVLHLAELIDRAEAAAETSR